MIGPRLRILVTVGRQRPVEAVSVVMRAGTDSACVEPDIPEEFRLVKEPFGVVRGHTFEVECGFDAHGDRGLRRLLKKAMSGKSWPVRVECKDEFGKGTTYRHLACHVAEPRAEGDNIVLKFVAVHHRSRRWPPFGEVTLNYGEG